jgi:predicted regulator of Ras-like GTPase activity (Roadblock/LC7/MglB family)
MPEAVEPRPAPRPEAPEIDILSLLPPELRQPSPLPASPEPAALAAPAAPPPTRLAPVAPPEDFDVGAMLAAEFRQPARPPRGPSEAERAARLAMGPPPGARAAPKGPSIAATSEIAGFVGSCLVDSETGLMLASEGGGDLDLEAVAALNTEVIRAEQEAIAALGLDDRLEDILVTTTRQVHVLRPLEATPSVFLYLALDRKAANLGMALRQLGRIEATLAP